MVKNRDILNVKSVAVYEMSNSIYVDNSLNYFSRCIVFFLIRQIIFHIRGWFFLFSCYVVFFGETTLYLNKLFYATSVTKYKKKKKIIIENKFVWNFNDFRLLFNENQIYAKFLENIKTNKVCNCVTIMGLEMSPIFISDFLIFFLKCNNAFEWLFFFTSRRKPQINKKNYSLFV